MGYNPWRGVTAETMQFFDVHSDEEKIVFPYGSEFRKYRKLLEKDFWSQGLSEDSVPLFGQDRFQGGEFQAVIITEGELDALSAFQMLGRSAACVSLKGAQHAKKDIGRAKDWLLAFDKIYLCLDSDEAGQEATAEITKLLPQSKLHYMSLDKFKDANEYLQSEEAPAFRAAFKTARKYRPKGVKADWADLDGILTAEDTKAIATYPFPTLQKMTYGIRPGELVLISAHQKMGKTEFIRAIEHHLLRTTDFNVGAIHLEEKEKRFVQGIAGYELGVPCHLPDTQATLEDQKSAYQKATKRDGRLLFYSHFGTDDAEIILETVRYMATAEDCKIIFLDNLTMLVNGQEETDERKTIDYITKALTRMALELNICICLIAHVNDNGQIFGSRMPGKICHLHVYLERDKENPDPEVRNQMKLMVRDNRFGGDTGPAGVLLFDRETYRLTEMTVEKAIDLDITRPVA